MLIGAFRSQGAGAPGTARRVSRPTAVLSAAIPLVATSLKAALQTATAPAVTLSLATIARAVTLLMAIWPQAIPLAVTLEAVSLTWATPPLDSPPLDTMLAMVSLPYLIVARLAAKPGEGVPPPP